MNPKKKPGARPGKIVPRRKVTMTPAQRAIHERIAAEAEHSQAVPPPFWEPAAYPTLWALLQAAIAEARARRRSRGRMLFKHEGKTYVARFSNLGRVIVECPTTGRFIAASAAFKL